MRHGLHYLMEYCIVYCKLLLIREAALEKPDNISTSAKQFAGLNGQTEFVRLLHQYAFYLGLKFQIKYYAKKAGDVMHTVTAC